LAGETRSILFDRAGAGWSELGRLPITINSEVEQLKVLLEAADEKGPFVLAGHSFGGLFCANFAQRYPELVAGLILTDPTPPANVTCAARLSFETLIRKAPWRAFALQLGLQRLGSPEITDHDSPFYKCLSDWTDIINRNLLQPKSVIAEAAAFEAR
jgi:pimeloyl-ACP methyl ester carboxylesterase